MSFLGDLMNGGQKQAPTSPAPYIPTPSAKGTILTEDQLKLNPDLRLGPSQITHVGIRG